MDAPIVSINGKSHVKIVFYFFSMFGSIKKVSKENNLLNFPYLA